jgi:hypothetical protein
MFLLFLGLLASEQTLSGVVKDADGKPVAVATVAPTSHAFTKDDAAAAITDAAGKFRLPKPRSMLLAGSTMGESGRRAARTDPSRTSPITRATSAPSREATISGMTPSTGHDSAT